MPAKAGIQVGRGYVLWKALLPVRPIPYTLLQENPIR